VPVEPQQHGFVQLAGGSFGHFRRQLGKGQDARQREGQSDNQVEAERGIESVQVSHQPSEDTNQGTERASRGGSGNTLGHYPSLRVGLL
jgi:hypothetical protein